MLSGTLCNVCLSDNKIKGNGSWKSIFWNMIKRNELKVHSYLLRRAFGIKWYKIHTTLNIFHEGINLFIVVENEFSKL